MPKVKKVVREGKVAVLVSPGLGSGFSTEIDEEDYPEIRKQAVFHPRWVQWVEEGKKEDPEVIRDEVWGDSPFYFSYTGTMNLKIEWVPEGTLFTIDQYDGHESLNFDIYKA